MWVRVFEKNSGLLIWISVSMIFALIWSCSVPGLLVQTLHTGRSSLKQVSSRAGQSLEIVVNENNLDFSRITLVFQVMIG